MSPRNLQIAADKRSVVLPDAPNQRISGKRTTAETDGVELNFSADGAERVVESVEPEPLGASEARNRGDGDHGQRAEPEGAPDPYGPEHPREQQAGRECEEQPQRTAQELFAVQNEA